MIPDCRISSCDYSNFSAGFLDDSSCFKDLGDGACHMSWTPRGSGGDGPLSTIACAIGPAILTLNRLPSVLVFI